jgi:hypothetical protein
MAGMAKIPALLILLTSLAAAQTVQASPESTTAEFVQRVEKSCASMVGHTVAQNPSTESANRFGYVLNGKTYSQHQYTQSDWLTEACNTADIQITYAGEFPSKAFISYRIDEQGHFLNSKKRKMFSVYSKLTYEYVNSEWVLRKMEAVSAK